MRSHGFTVSLLVLSVIGILCVYGCNQAGKNRPPKADAVAVLMPTEGGTVGGVVTFSKVEGGVRVIADIVDLAPGPHGIHIHEFGDCRAADGASAGGHYNPLNNPHGAPDAQKRHVGDLGNIIADANGLAALDIVDTHLALEGPHSIIGRSVVLHAKADDFKTQPHGNAGARLACGVIGIARN